MLWMFPTGTFQVITFLGFFPPTSLSFQILSSEQWNPVLPQLRSVRLLISPWIRHRHQWHQHMFVILSDPRQGEWKPLLDRCSQTLWTKSLPTLPVLRLDLFILLFSVCEVKPLACGNKDTETPGIVIWKWEFLGFSRESKLNVRKL